VKLKANEAKLITFHPSRGMGKEKKKKKKTLTLFQIHYYFAKSILPILSI